MYKTARLWYSGAMTTTAFTLTPANRDLLEQVLLDDINDRDSHTRVGSMSYLGTLQHVSDGAVIDDSHELWDVVEYFVLHDALEVN